MFIGTLNATHSLTWCCCCQRAMIVIAEFLCMRYHFLWVTMKVREQATTEWSCWLCYRCHSMSSTNLYLGCRSVYTTMAPWLRCSTFTQRIKIWVPLSPVWVISGVRRASGQHCSYASEKSHCTRETSFWTCRCLKCHCWVDELPVSVCWCRAGW